MTQALDQQAVQRVARLARLRLTGDEAARAGTQLQAILGYFERLNTLDLSGVEPMATPIQTGAPLAADELGPVIDRAAFMAMAPDHDGVFLKVPKVMAEGSA